jgi:nicotinate-nucleotide adenylyltransferase
VKRIGIFGGTFDPVHVGHLVAAVWCRDALDLDQVLLVVANEPWQKVGTRDVAPASARYEVVRAAVEGIEGLEASPVEIDRGGPSFTADTVLELQGSLPGAELFLLVGSDVARDLGTWQRIGEIDGVVTLGVVDRTCSGDKGGAGDAGQVPLPWRGRAEHVRMPTIEVSSSELRDRLRRGLSVDFLIPPSAIRRIRDLGLYSVGR